MVIFPSVFCKRLPEGKPPFSYGFPMGFPIQTSIFLWDLPHWPGQKLSHLAYDLPGRVQGTIIINHY